MLRFVPMIVLACTPLLACGSEAPDRVAAPTSTPEATAVPAVPAADAPDAAVEARLREALHGLAPNARIDRIRASEVDGLYELHVSGTVLYMSADGRHLVQGSVLEIETRADLTERARGDARRPLLDAVGPEERIVFGDPDAEHRVTVFTDVDCGYCRRMHHDVARYNELGITIEYLSYPINGPGSEGWRKSVAVWCAEDRQQAMTDAKAGRSIPMVDCDNPVQRDYELARRVGATGTPAVYNIDGVQIGGYVMPRQMLQRLRELQAGRGR